MYMTALVQGCPVAPSLIRLLLLTTLVSGPTSSLQPRLVMGLQYTHFTEGQEQRDLGTASLGPESRLVTTCWSHSSHDMGRGLGQGLPWLALGSGDPDHSHGSAGASPAWGALEGCKWCLWHPPVSREARALSCMSSCTCWASGMSMRALTGTATSVSTGMRSSQVSPVVHRPGWACESTEKRAMGVGQAPGVVWLFGRGCLSSPPSACLPWGRWGTPCL